MNSMPNRLSDLQFQQVGNYVRVFNPHNGRRYKLPLKQALLLLSLDGESWPGENTGLNLSKEELFNGLKKLYRNGLLQMRYKSQRFCMTSLGRLCFCFPVQLGIVFFQYFFINYCSGCGFRFLFLLLLWSPSMVVCLPCPH